MNLGLRMSRSGPEGGQGEKDAGTAGHSCARCHAGKANSATPDTKAYRFGFAGNFILDLAKCQVLNSGRRGCPNKHRH
jgi:hypothetical protein